MSKKNISNIIQTEEKLIQNPLIITKVFEELKLILAGLYYISETDALIEVEEIEAISIKDLIEKNISKKQQKYVANLDWESFFTNKLVPQDWHDPFMIEQTQKMIDLKALISENFKEINYIKVGEVEIDAFMLMMEESGRTFLMKTKMVET